jgi:hypothetical protein
MGASERLYHSLGRECGLGGLPGKRSRDAFPVTPYHTLIIPKPGCRRVRDPVQSRLPYNARGHRCRQRGPWRLSYRVLPHGVLRADGHRSSLNY